MPTLLLVLIVAVSALDIFILCLPWLLRKRGVWLWWHTKFGPALVFDSQDDDGTTVRLLNVRGKYQSVAYVDPDLRWELACIYHKYFAEIVDIVGLTGNSHTTKSIDQAGKTTDPQPLLDDKDCSSSCLRHVPPSDCLRQASSEFKPAAVVIGGGGYSFPKWLVAHCPCLHTVVVEIDPAITKIARKHFFLNELLEEFPDNVPELICDDGWAWLRNCHRSFDLIVNDAFSGKHPLGPLGTAEGARLIHQHLTSQGVYLANVIAPLEGKGSRHLQDTCHTFCAEFKYVWLIPEDEEDPNTIANNCLIASNHPWPISHRYLLS